MCIRDSGRLSCNAPHYFSHLISSDFIGKLLVSFIASPKLLNVGKLITFLAHSVHCTVQRVLRVNFYKLEFHGITTRTPAPTRTSSLTSTRGSSRGCRRVRRLPRSACHEPNKHDDPCRLVCRLVRHARFSSRGCPLGMRACTRVNVYCTR